MFLTSRFCRSFLYLFVLLCILPVSQLSLLSAQAFQTRYVFGKTNNEWAEDNKLFVTNPIPDQHLGLDVADSGTAALLGIYNDSNKRQSATYRFNIDVPTTYTVTNTADSGPGSLRQAILDANTNPGQDTIAFNIPGTGVQAIVPSSALPNITDSVILDGCTQPGSNCSTWPLTLRVELSGSSGNKTYGLKFLADNNILRGLIINRFESSVFLAGSSNWIYNNYIGTDASGTIPLTEANGLAGIQLMSSSYNVIGTNGDGIADGQERNLIYDGQYNIILVTSDHNVIAGNYMNVNASGTQALNASHGEIFIADGHDNLVGTNGDGISDNLERNLCSFIEIVGGSSNNTIAGNYIGVSVGGQVIITNSGIAIWANGGSGRPHHNRVGTNSDGISDALEQNILEGMILEGTDYNVIAGNYIGIQANGVTPFPAVIYPRIHIENATYNLLGTNGDGVRDAVERNVIGGYAEYGLITFSSAPTYNIVAGNYIGTTAAGTGDTSNSNGIQILGGHDNVIGGSLPAMGNLIASNVTGVLVAGTGTQNNPIQNNVIRSNDALGIDLDWTPDTGLEIRPPLSATSSIGDTPLTASGFTGVNPNDALDADSGPNGLQNYPVLVTVTPTVVSGTLISAPNTTYTLHFYSNPSCDPSGYGEGETYQGSKTVTTAANGNGIFSYTFNNLLPAGHVVTATATDPNGNTSEFSACKEISAAANQPPVNTLPGTQQTLPDTILIFDAMNPIRISDPDAGTNPVQVSLSVTKGALTLSTSSGLTFTVGDGTNDANLTFTGTISAINAALNDMFFTPPAGLRESITLTLTTNDQGYSGTGGAMSDTDVLTIVVDWPFGGCSANPTDSTDIICTSR